MACPDENVLHEFSRGALSDEATLEVDAHLDGCSRCRQLVAALASESGIDSVTAPSSLPSAMPRNWNAGDFIGRYRIDALLGAGGMGTVFAAWDPELNRKVALKLVRVRPSVSANVTTGQSRARLLREARAMALLQHPNVVAVFDLGTVNDELFIAMEHVERGTLEAWLARGSKHWREVVRMFAAAGEGLAAAHQAGLVHGDFKPANVLLGTDGRARVTDFGLARQESDPHEGLAGSPPFIAPEQWSGLAPDARSDQFSFSVALYLALFGSHPFPARTPEERIARLKLPPEQMPATPRVPNRIRKAILRGIAANPTARHPSMRELLAALQEPKTRWPRVAAVAGTLALAGAVGFVSTRDPAAACRSAPSPLAGVWDDSTRAKVKQAFAADPRPYAKDAYEQVAATLNSYASAWTATSVQSCEATARGEQSVAANDLKRACLDRRKADLAALVDVLGRADDAAIRLAPNAARQLEPIEGCLDVAALSGVVPLPESAKEQVSSAEAKVAAVRALSGAGYHKEALSLAQPLAKVEVGYPPVEAAAAYALGIALEDSGQFAPAADAYRTAALTAEAGRDDLQAARAWASDAFVVAHQLAKPLEAKPLLDLATAKSLRLGAHHAELDAQLSSVAGAIALANGELEEAAKIFQAGLDKARVGLGPGHPLTRKLASDTASALTQVGRHKDAIPLVEQALRDAEAAVGKSHPELKQYLVTLAITHRQMGHGKEASAYFERARLLIESAEGPDHPSIAECWNGLGAIAKDERRLPDALDAFSRAEALRTKVLGPEHPLTLGSRVNVAIVQRMLGRYEEAVARHREVAEVAARTLNPKHPLIVGALVSVADDYYEWRHYQDALTAYERALKTSDAGLGREHLYTLAARVGLAESYAQVGQKPKARAEFESAISVLEQKDLDPALLAQARFGLAKILTRSEMPRAKALAEQAKSAWSQEKGYEEETAEVSAWLAAQK